MLAYTAYSLPQLAVSNTFGSSVFSFLYFLFMSAVVLGAAYLATRYIAKKGVSGKNGRNLKLVETLNLGMDKSVFLIKAGEQYFLMGNSNKTVTLLTEIEADKLKFVQGAESAESVQGTGEFREIKGESVENYMKKLTADESQNELYSVKGSLLKLKSMVRGNRLNEKS